MVTEAKLGHVDAKKDGSHWAAVMSELNLSIEIGSKEEMPPQSSSPPPPSSDKQAVAPQNQTPSPASDPSIFYNQDSQDYSNLKNECKEQDGESVSDEEELRKSIKQCLHTLEFLFENINVKITDQSNKSTMVLSLGMVRFNGTISENESERTSAIRIGRITLKSEKPEGLSSEPEEDVVFSFEPGEKSLVEIIQTNRDKIDADSNEGIFDEVLSAKRLAKINIKFPDTKVHARVSIDKVQIMKDLIFKFIDALITTNEQERKGKDAAENAPSNPPSISFYGLVDSNKELHNNTFWAKVNVFNDLNHKEAMDNSDFNVIFGEITLDILAKEDQDRKGGSFLRCVMETIEFNMESQSGLINASVGSIAGAIVREREEIQVFKFTKGIKNEKDVEVYLTTDTNMDFRGGSIPDAKLEKQTRGYLIKVATAKQLVIDFHSEILKILFENKILDLTPLAKKSEAGPEPPSANPEDDKEQQSPVKNSGSRLSITMKSTLRIRLNVYMETVLPREEIKRRSETVGYMFIHNLLKDYLGDDRCAFDIGASSLSFISISTQGSANSSVMGIGFDTLCVQLTRGMNKARTVFKSMSKKSGTNQPYPILITSNSANGRHFIEVDMKHNGKTSNAFNFLEPDKIYEELIDENKQDDSEFQSMCLSNDHIKTDDGQAKNWKINNEYDFNTIFSDPYLIYGNIPKEEAETLNWNYYSSKCVNIKCLYSLFI